MSDLAQCINAYLVAMDKYVSCLNEYLEQSSFVSLDILHLGGILLLPQDRQLNWYSNHDLIHLLLVAHIRVLTRIHFIYYDKRLLKIQKVTSLKFSIADSTSHLLSCLFSFYTLSRFTYYFSRLRSCFFHIFYRLSE